MSKQFKKYFTRSANQIWTFSIPYLVVHNVQDFAQILYFVGGVLIINRNNVFHSFPDREITCVISARLLIILHMARYSQTFIFSLFSYLSKVNIYKYKTKQITTYNNLLWLHGLDAISSLNNKALFVVHSWSLIIWSILMYVTTVFSTTPHKLSNVQQCHNKWQLFALMIMNELQTMPYYLVMK
jgi:hypothetical protein